MTAAEDLIEDFLPDYDVRSRHGTVVNAPPPVVYEAVRRLDLSNARTARWLFRMRGRPASALTLEGVQRMGFLLLGERTDREIILGLVARFWTVRGELQRLDVEGFRRFHGPGYAKAVWSFSVTPAAKCAARLWTETRVLCLDDRSGRAFRWYWLAIRPLSAWIRRIALRRIKEDAEACWDKP